MFRIFVRQLKTKDMTNSKTQLPLFVQLNSTFYHLEHYKMTKNELVHYVKNSDIKEISTYHWAIKKDLIGLLDRISETNNSYGDVVFVSKEQMEKLSLIVKLDDLDMLDSEEMLEKLIENALED